MRITIHIYSLTISLDINLTSLIPELDNTASDIVTYQRDSTVQRKELAQKTKDFRKLDDASKLVEYKALLKGKLFHSRSCELLLIII